MNGIFYDFIDKIVIVIIVNVIGWFLTSIIALNLRNLGFGKYKRRLTFENINKKNNALMEYNVFALGTSAISVLTVLLVAQIYVKHANSSDIIIVDFCYLMQIGIIKELVNNKYFSQIVIVAIMVISQMIFYISLQYKIREVLNNSKKKMLYYYFQSVVCYLPIFITIFGANLKITLVMYTIYFFTVVFGLMIYSDMKITKFEMRTNILLTVGEDILGISSKNVKRKDNFLMIIMENRKIEIPYDKIKRIESIEVDQELR